MPRFVVQKVAEALNSVESSIKGSRGLLVGVAYKPHTDDVRESPAFKLIDLLDGFGATLSYHDPHVPSLPRTRRCQKEIDSVGLDAETLSQHDFTLIVTDHEGIDWDLVVEHSRIVVDTRNATRNVTSGRDKIFKA